MSSEYQDPFAGWQSKRKFTNTARNGNFSVDMHTPIAWTKERKGLPPYDPRLVIPVANIPDPPEEWVIPSTTDEGVPASAFVLPTFPGRGAWFDFHGNRSHPHHVAVFPRVQGLNSETAIQAPRAVLEQYRAGMTCPNPNHAHATFAADAFCPLCGFMWPAQNYLATTTGTAFWLDGFRVSGSNGMPEAYKRQFSFTEDERRGVAAQIIGGDRTHSLDFAFFTSRQPKPPPAPATRHGGRVHSYGGFEFETLGNRDVKGVGAFGRRALFSTSSLEVGAGVKIEQDSGVDPNSLDFWNGTPAAFVVIHFTPAEVLAEILRTRGLFDRTLGGEGPLAGLVVGAETGTTSFETH